MQWSPLQEGVFDFVQHGTGSANVIARAGTGKTTTLVEAVNRTKGRALTAAFNKSIADELASRVHGNPYATAATLHSVGFKLWRNTKPKSEVDSRKVRTLAKTLVSWDKTYIDILCDAVGYAKGAGFGIPSVGPYEYDTEAGNKLWSDMLDFHDLWDEVPTTITPERVIEDCAKIYQQSIIAAKYDGKIDFDDMILLPLLPEFSQGKSYGQYDWVMVDEAQDTSDTRRLLALAVLKNGGRFMAVGDPCQCQPPGTLVTLDDGSTLPIEDLCRGDKLTSFDRRGSYFMGRSRDSGFEVTATCERPYSGTLIGVNTLVHGQPRATKCTPNHKFLVRWTERSHELWVTYLMRRGEHFRLGWCQLFNKTCKNFHLALRARLENADAAWILGTHQDKQSASIEESMLSTEFGLPLLPFHEHNVGSGATLYTQKALDSFWSDIASVVDLKANAVKVLRDFGREIDYPLWSEKTNRKRGRTTLFETQACNLISDLMSVPVYQGTREVEWTPLIITKERYNGPVYSLDVQKHHNYVADGIVTCNSIYLFAGASLGAMDKIKCATGAIELPLNITYRCPQSVVKMANQWVPDFTAHESAPQGIIRNIHHSKFWMEQLTSKDVILCRNTRPLVGIAGRLRDNGIQCVVEGQSGKALIGLATKWGDIEIRDLLMNLEAYREKEYTKWFDKGKEDKAEWVNEKVGILSDIARGLPEDDSVNKLVQKIEFTFGEGQYQGKDLLRLCTVHRSKGREWDRVYLIGRNRYMPSKWATKEHECQQETNLQYVAVTRTKEELVEVKVPIPDPKKPSQGDWWEL